MLLARGPPTLIATSATTSLRGVFEPDDAWLETGDLFRRDVDGDFWLVDHAPRLIRTAAGVVPSRPIEDALGDVDAIELAVAYGVPTKDGSSRIPCAAVTLREGHGLDIGRGRATPSPTSARGDPLGRPGRRRDPADHLVPTA